MKPTIFILSLLAFGWVVYSQLLKPKEIPNVENQSSTDSVTHRNEETENRSLHAGHSKRDSKTPGDIRASHEENSKLLSIYPRQVKPEKRPTQKIIHGVPLNDWVLSEGQALRTKPAPPAPNDLKVIVQCVEFEGQKVHSLNKSECASARPGLARGGDFLRLNGMR